MRVPVHKIAAFFTLMLGLVIRASAREEPLVTGNGYRGVIVPIQWAEASSHLAKRFTGFWVPSTNDIASAEVAVAQYMATAQADAGLDPYTQRQAPSISKKLPTYRRQYVGITVGAEK